VSKKPIVSLDALSYVVAPAGGDLFSPSLSQIEVVPEEGMLKAVENFEEGRFPLFPWGKYNIKVTYTYGFNTIPDELAEAIQVLTAEKVLAMLEGRGGGGPSVTINGYSRNYGNMGKYTNVRKDLARWGVGLAKKYMTGVVAG
jgi:hypothetical protein